VLVVDDNELNVVLVKMLLSAERLEVAAAGNGQQALAAVASFRPDLVLLDLELPDVNGLTLARQLKSDAATRDIPIVVLTAHAARDVEAAVREAGCEGFVSKPVDPRTFAAALQRYLR
jgi:CheY-like chemotaxis protein